VKAKCNRTRAKKRFFGNSDEQRSMKLVPKLLSVLGLSVASVSALAEARHLNQWLIPAVNDQNLREVH
jgi:hypothetical protein